MDDDARKRHNEALMDEFIRLAREDAVSVGIFPEGERFSGIAVEGAKREHVGELKGKPGFRKLCEHLPRHAIVSLTVVWPPVKAGKTVLDADAFVGQTVEVIVKFHPHVTANDADAFLESEWDEKDAMQNLSPADLGR